MLFDTPSACRWEIHSHTRLFPSDILDLACEAVILTVLQKALGSWNLECQSRVDIALHFKFAELGHAEPGDMSLQRVSVVARDERDTDLKMSGDFSPESFVKTSK